MKDVFCWVYACVLRFLVGSGREGGRCRKQVQTVQFGQDCINTWGTAWWNLCGGRRPQVDPFTDAGLQLEAGISGNPPAKPKRRNCTPVGSKSVYHFLLHLDCEFKLSYPRSEFVLPSIFLRFSTHNNLYSINPATSTGTLLLGSLRMEKRCILCLVGLEVQED